MNAADVLGRADVGGTAAKHKRIVAARFQIDIEHFQLLRRQQLRGDGNDRPCRELHIEDVVIVRHFHIVVVALAVRPGFRAITHFNRRCGGKGVLLVEYPLQLRLNLRQCVTWEIVVEDELSIQRILQYDLMQSGFIVDLASDGEEGLQKARRNSYDVMILDVMLPKRDGFSVCKELRKEENPVYIVMLSARDDEFDRVMGLDVGADDYMTKPFSSREVVSKVKAIMRRKGMHHQKACTERLSYQQLILDQRRFEVLINEEVIDFTLKEYELLEFLIHHQGQALSRNLLLDRLWGYEYDGDTRIVDVHIFKIREKLKPYGIKIKTIRGIGYMLEDEKND